MGIDRINKNLKLDNNKAKQNKIQISKVQKYL